MKIVKSNGKYKMVMSKKEWTKIGNENQWIKKPIKLLAAETLDELKK